MFQDMKKRTNMWFFVALLYFICSQSQAAQLHDLKQVQLLSRVLDQAHRIYSETWRVLLASKSSPTSPMKIIADELKKKRVTAKEKAWAIPELVEFSAQERKMVFEFQPDHFAQAFGESLVILNRRARCEISYDEKEKIKNLICRGLGRNLSKTQHIEFHEINYSAKESQLLEVKADKYENLLKKSQCSSSEPCLQMKVPFDGQIKIIENHILEKEKTEPPPPSNAQIENNKENNAAEKPEEQNQSIETKPEVENEKSEHRQRRTEVPVEGDREPGL